MPFEDSVFINCPFDSKYNVLLHCMLFTITALGFQPRIALESTDAGTLRLDLITELISESKYSVHDLSRVKPTRKGEFSRLNMPFEYGLDFGCRKFSNGSHCEKKFLVIGGNKYDYMKALSDISGIDIKYHNDEPTELAKVLRHWFVTNSSIKDAPSPHEIWMKFMDFQGDYVLFARSKGYSGDDMYDIPFNEQIEMIRKFITSNPFL